MIIDQREILFEAEALLLVLAGSPRAAAAFGLPAGMPHGVVFEPASDAVRFVWPGQGASRAASVEAAKLGALLVGFCLRMRIPLPRRAEKSIRVEPGMVVLAFRTSVKPDLLSVLPEGRLPEGSAAPSERKWAST